MYHLSASWTNVQSAASYVNAVPLDSCTTGTPFGRTETPVMTELGDKSGDTDIGAKTAVPFLTFLHRPSVHV
jgi:hypothetical protein